MSGTRVTTIRMPLTAPSASPIASTKGTTNSAYSSLAPSIMEAAVTLVSAIIDGDRKVDAAGEDHDGLRRHGEGVRQHRAHQRAEIAGAVARLDRSW